MVDNFFNQQYIFDQNKKYIKDSKSGHWVSYYENGNKEWEGNYKNNQKDSVFTYWYPTGQILKKTYYSKGYDSVLVGWNKKGEQSVVNGNGELMEFYNDGSPKGKLIYNKGKVHGKIVKWYENGNVWYTSEFKRGIKNGIHKVYYVNGQIKDSTQFVNGKEHGKFYSFKLDGTKESEGFFKMGQEDSTWTWFNKNFVRIEGTFKNGLRNGRWLFNYPGTNKKEHIAFFKNGLKEGKWKYFYKSGGKLRIANFKNDKRNGKWSVYFENGKLDHEGKFKNDKEHGIWTSWHEKNERINEKGSFNMGIMDGKWEGFYDNGNQKFIANYNNGIKHGEYVKFYPNGRIGIKETYSNGLLEGKFESYYDQGFFLREKGQYKLVKPALDKIRNKLDTIIVKSNGDTIKVEKDPLIKFREKQKE